VEISALKRNIENTRVLYFTYVPQVPLWLRHLALKLRKLAIAAINKPQPAFNQRGGNLSRYVHFAFFNSKIKQFNLWYDYLLLYRLNVYLLDCESDYSSSNVFVNAPYFDGLTHWIRGADGLPWWSPSQVLATICCVCSVEVCACMYCFVRY
jgi:hypothetical protein